MTEVAEKVNGRLYMIIERNDYLNKLINRKNNGLVKIITGIRRCGKSYLLDPIFKNYLINDGVK